MGASWNSQHGKGAPRAYSAKAPLLLLLTPAFGSSWGIHLDVTWDSQEENSLSNKLQPPEYLVLDKLLRDILKHFFTMFLE